MEGQKTPRQWGMRLGKWEAMIIIAFIVILGIIIVARMVIGG